MFLKRVRVKKYRSIRDSGWFDVDQGKTILIGPNEAGKTALLGGHPATQSSPWRSRLRSSARLSALRVRRYQQWKSFPSQVTVVEGHFGLTDEDKAELPEEFRQYDYVFGRRLDNSFWHDFLGAPPAKKFAEIKKDLTRFCAHIDSRHAKPEAGMSPDDPPSTRIVALLHGWKDDYELAGQPARLLKEAIEKSLPHVEEGNAVEEKRYDDLVATIEESDRRATALWNLGRRLPLFIRFRDFLRVRPLIHLDHLATRIERNLIDDEYYDYGNKCLLKLLGFSARELSNLGKRDEPPWTTRPRCRCSRDQLDRRSYQLNSASVKLTDELRATWMPDSKRDEAERLRIVCDGQYLKVIVEDDVGVEIELDQRSDGFQWLVSFFIVFFAEAAQNHKNAILLLDEPGLSLHALKQREFRHTISRLAESNQTIYTTHSPFLVGPDELNLVRVVEMTDRTVGTKVHTGITAEDPVALLPLQEALGYDLAQSLFAQQRNLVLESLTDYWYLDAVAQMMRDGGDCRSRRQNCAYACRRRRQSGLLRHRFARLQTQSRGASWMEKCQPTTRCIRSDSCNTLGNKSVLRTKDAYDGPVNARGGGSPARNVNQPHARETELAQSRTTIRPRSVVDILQNENPGFLQISSGQNIRALDPRAQGGKSFRNRTRQLEKTHQLDQRRVELIRSNVQHHLARSFGALSNVQHISRRLRAASGGEGAEFSQPAQRPAG